MIVSETFNKKSGIKGKNEMIPVNHKMRGQYGYRNSQL